MIDQRTRLVLELLSRGSLSAAEIEEQTGAGISYLVEMSRAGYIRSKPIRGETNKPGGHGIQISILSAGRRALVEGKAFQIPTLKKSTIRSRKGLGLELDVAELVRRFLTQQEGKAAKPPVGNEGIQELPPGFSIENVGFQKWNILENGVVVGTSDSKRHAVDKANRIAVGQEPRKTKSLPIDDKGLKEKVQLIIDKLTERYGASQAMAIVTSGQAVGWAATVIGTVLTGVPTWVPGSSVWGMAPGIALAEAYRQFHGKSIKSQDDIRVGRDFYHRRNGKIYRITRIQRQGGRRAAAGNGEINQDPLVSYRLLDERGNPYLGPDHSYASTFESEIVASWKSIKGITASRFMLADLVNDFRHFMERLRNYGIRVPSLSDEQIARTLEAAINESERMEFGGRTRGKSMQTKGADELLRMWQAGPSKWTNDEIARNVNQMSNEESTKLGQAMHNDSDKYTRQQIRQAFEHRFESWNRIQFRSMKSIDEWQGRKLEEWDDRALREFIQSWGGLVPGKANREDLLKIVRRRIRFLESQGREVKSVSSSDFEKEAQELELKIRDNDPKWENPARKISSSEVSVYLDPTPDYWNRGWTDSQINKLVNEVASRINRSYGKGKHLTKSIALPDERQDESWSCGAAAVVSVCRYFSIEPDTESEAIWELGSSPSDGTPPQSIIDVLELHGLATDARDWFNLTDLYEKHLKKGHPVLCPIQMYGNPAEYSEAEGGHWVVLTGVWDGKVCLQDPVAGKVEMDVEEFKSRWHDKGADGNPYEQYGIACWKPAIDVPSVVYTDRWAIPMMKRSPFVMRKSLLPYLFKAEGTCQQGERADLTGCTPASGEGGGSSGGESKPVDSKQRDIQNIKEALERAKESGKKKHVEQLQRMHRDLGEPESSENSRQGFSSKKEMDKWGKENFSAWEKGLSKEEKKALLQYAGPMFFDTNSSLRSDGSVPDKWKESVKNLDAAIEKSVIPNDITAYRGLWLDGKEQSQKFIDKFVPGAVLSDPGFMSTSINREIASDFGGEKLGSGIVIEIKVPKGSKGAYMDVLPENAKHFKQNEILLPRGAKFKVVSVEKGKAVVELVNE